MSKLKFYIIDSSNGQNYFTWENQVRNLLHHLLPKKYYNRPQKNTAQVKEHI